MPDTFNYPAEIERDEDGRFVITFPDFGWGATDGATRDEALAEAKDLLRELIATTIREGETLPEPSRPGKSRPLACISHHPTVEARDTTARSSLRLLAVLDVLFKYACARQAARASS